MDRLHSHHRDSDSLGGGGVKIIGSIVGLLAAILLFLLALGFVVALWPILVPVGFAVWLSKYDEKRKR